MFISGGKLSLSILLFFSKLLRCSLNWGIRSLLLKSKPSSKPDNSPFTLTISGKSSWYAEILNLSLTVVKSVLRPEYLVYLAVSVLWYFINLFKSDSSVSLPDKTLFLNKSEKKSLRPKLLSKLVVNRVRLPSFVLTTSSLNPKAKFCSPDCNVKFP